MTTPSASTSPNNGNNAEVARLVGIVDSTFETLFGLDHRDTTENEVITSSTCQECSSMLGKKILLVDDSLHIICKVFPLLTGATGGKASVISVSEEALGKEAYSLLTAHKLAELIVAAKPDYVLMDWDLGKDFDGTDVAQELRRIAPDLPCIGFSGQSGSFDRQPVVAFVRKDKDDVMGSLIGVARVIKSRSLMQAANSDTPLAPLTKTQTRDRNSAPELLLAISILCQGYLLVHGNAEHHAAIGLTEPLPEGSINPDAGEAFSDPKMWKDTLVTEQTLALLNEEVLDPVESKTVVEFISGLCRDDITEISLETVASMFREIEVELRN